MPRRISPPHRLAKTYNFGGVLTLGGESFTFQSRGAAERREKSFALHTREMISSIVMTCFDGNS